jgi:TonB family protein
LRLGFPDSYTPPRPKVLSPGTVGLAVVLHLLVFAVFAVVAAAQGLFEKKETIIPIDLTVIVNENLDGVENEPPPLLNPPPPEKPRPKAKKRKEPRPEPKKPDPPKPLEQIVTNIVTKTDRKKDKGDKDKDKKPDEKKPEPPKKTAKELAEERKRQKEERLKRIREGVKVVNRKKVDIEVPDAKASGNGRTGRQTMSKAEILRRLNEGYRPGTTNQLATNEKQRCLSLIQMAIEERWDRMMPKVGRDGTVLLSVQFNSAGGLVNVRLQRSCGDALSDQAALAVARSVTSIRGLSAEFLSEFRKEPLTIRYQVRGR